MQYMYRKVTQVWWSQCLDVPRKYRNKVFTVYQYIFVTDDHKAKKGITTSLGMVIGKRHIIATGA